MALGYCFFVFYKQVVPTAQYLNLDALDVWIFWMLNFNDQLSNHNFQIISNI